MSDFVIFTTAWVVSGFLGMFFIKRIQWERGQDITVLDVILGILGSIAFGAILWGYLLPNFILSLENKVLIKGKKNE